MMENLMFDLPQNKSANIKVIGVGGGGGNAVNYMYQQGIKGVDFVICNTDAQALNNSPIPNKIQLGVSITEGLGAGANPEVGEQAALESLEEIKILLDANTKMVFITAGMGGGTGTGAAPIIAGLAKEMGILTIGICTAPFQFEGKSRIDQAQKGVEKLRDNVDSLIVINNNKLRELYGNLGYKTGFAKADEVLATAAKGIAEVITHNYAVNIDLRDAKTVLANSGTAIMGSATAEGDNKAQDAIMNALDSPLLNNNKITGAKNVLLLILSGNEEITIDEIGMINDHIQAEAGNNANIIMGIGEDQTLENKISITVVATGFPMDEQKYTGKEQQKIFHQLEEDQAFTQELEPKQTAQEPPLPATERTILQLEDEQQEPENEMLLNDEYDMEEDEIQLKSNHTDQDQQPDITPSNSFNQQQPTLFDLESNQNPTTDTDSFDASIDEPTEEKTIIFTLNDDEFEDEADFLSSPKDNQPSNQQPVNQASELKLNAANHTANNNQENNQQAQALSNNASNPFDSPITDALNSKISERRERLKQFNFSFKKNLSEQQIDENERIPAFKRQGLELDDTIDESAGMYLSEGEDNQFKIKPNDYLNRNVD